MVIEMDLLRKKTTDEIIDSLGSKDIPFMKQLLKDLIKLDLYEQIELDEDMDRDDLFYAYYDMSQKIEDEVNFYLGNKEEQKTKSRNNKKRRS